MRSYVCTRDIHKRVMFANYIFANITSFAKFGKISSRENFQVHGIAVSATSGLAGVAPSKLRP